MTGFSLGDEDIRSYWTSAGRLFECPGERTRSVVLAIVAGVSPEDFDERIESIIRQDRSREVVVTKKKKKKR